MTAGGDGGNAADPDAALMLRAARGDDSAFAGLVEKYRRPVLNFFVRQGVSPNDGEDLAQQTFIRIYSYRSRYSPDAKFTTFLFLVARRILIDDVRRRDREARLHLRYGEEAGLESPPEAQPLAGEDVRRAVARLSPPLRDVVELGVFQDLPYADVGRILGIPVGTVKSRMFSALRKLKELLDEQRS